MPIETGLKVLEDAEGLIDKIVPTANVREIALQLAVQANHSFYDALFVAVAIQEEVQVITFDRKLAAKFPDRVQLLK